MPEVLWSTQVKSFAAENSGMQARMQGVLDAQKTRTVEVVRAAERSRAQMLCEKAAAEHDLVQACTPGLPSPCLALCSCCQCCTDLRPGLSPHVVMSA